MTDSQRVDVARLSEIAHWLRRFSDNGQHKRIQGPSSGDAYEAGVEIDGIAADLLQQLAELEAHASLHDRQIYAHVDRYEAAESKLAERDAEVVRLWDALAMANDQISELGGESDKLRMKVAELNGENAQLQFALENSETAFSAAERAREEATSLLYEADAHLRAAWIADETRMRIAAFLAANK